jgi:8-oxo-dGTP diphosphatase
MNEKHYKNPTPTVDAIIQKNSQILLIERKKEPFRGYLVLPGGFVNEGERVEDAVKREVKEETSLDIVLLEILGVYSEPRRDPRGHVMSTVFIGKISKRSYRVDAIARDDAAAIKWLNLEAVVNTRFGFDHRKIITDFIRWKQIGGTFWSTKNDM